jgi:hypothetical protein
VAVALEMVAETLDDLVGLHDEFLASSGARPRSTARAPG